MIGQNVYLLKLDIFMFFFRKFVFNKNYGYIRLKLAIFIYFIM